jgi:Tfp pilus assembly protein PilN
MIERIEINLLPAEYRVRKRSMNLPRSIVYPVMIFLVFACGAGLYTVYLRDKQARLEEEIAVIEKDIQANAHIQAEINKLREDRKVTEEKIKALQRINVNREKWVRLLEVLSGKLPAYTWLMSVKEESGGEQLVIEARTYSFPEVAHYMTRLEENEYISAVILSGIEQIQGQGRMLYRFSITCTLNKDAGLTTGAAADSTGGGGRQ